MDIALTDDLLDVLVQTEAWKRFFAHCLAVPTPEGCSHCGRSKGRVALTPGDRDRVKGCLLNADPARISGLKSALNATKLIVFTRAASGTLQQHHL